MLGRAIYLASVGHLHQKRWDGSAYIEHPLRVMNAMPNDEVLRCCAVLHDTIEDTLVSADMMRDYNISDEVIYVVENYLTRGNGVAYMDYIQKLGNNPYARTVKLADLEDNMRGVEVPEERLNRWVKRLRLYKEAYAYLREQK